MATSFLSSTRRLLANLWGFVDATRRTVLNLLFLAIVIALIVMVVRSGGQQWQENRRACRGPGDSWYVDN